MPPTIKYNTQKVLKKRDRLLNMVGVAEEQMRIYKEKYNQFEKYYPAKKEEYIQWCILNNVPNLITDE